MKVTGAMLKAKSEEWSKKIGHDDFKVTDGRYGVKIKKAYGEQIWLMEFGPLPNLENH